MNLVSKAYLFSYFEGNGEDGLHLAWSRDGYKWQALGSGKSYLRPDVGESKLMRDPSVLLAPDGTFHMVWTTAWNGVTIGYASSKDLVNWSEQRAIPVMANFPDTRNCWAPEMAYDAKRGEFLIFWSSTVAGFFPETAGLAEDNYNHRLYGTTTKDFVTFTPARLLFDPGFIVIDSTIIHANGKYQMIFKDETVKPPKKYLQVASSDELEGPYENLSAPFAGPDWVEGPTTIKIGEDYVVYYDIYSRGRYGAMRTRDFKNWGDVSELIELPKGVRHGTAIEVPLSAIEKLLNEGG